MKMTGLIPPLVVAGFAVSMAMALPSVVFALPPVPGPVPMDGDPDKWGAVALDPRTGAFVNAGTVGNQYVWRDAENVAFGNGSYTEAFNENITLSQSDIEEFRFAYDADNMYFFVRVFGDQEFFNPDQVGSRVSIYIDRPDVAGGSSTTLIGNHENFQQTPRVNFGSGFEFNYNVSNRSSYESSYLYIVDGNVSIFDNNVVPKAENLANRVIEMAVPWSQVGGYPNLPMQLRLIVGVGGADGGDWRSVEENAGDFNFGGGCPDGSLNARFLDLAGAPTEQQVHDDLTAVCSGPEQGGALATITNTIITIPLDDDVLLVELERFVARSAGVGSPVAIRWSTASEIDNVGFHVYRLRLVDGELVPAGRVNEALIPGAGTTSEGAQYSLRDSQPLAEGERRAYVLVDIDANGNATRHGPFRVQVRHSDPSGEADWPIY